MVTPNIGGNNVSLAIKSLQNLGPDRMVRSSIADLSAFRLFNSAGSQAVLDVHALRAKSIDEQWRQKLTEWLVPIIKLKDRTNHSGTKSGASTKKNQINTAIKQFNKHHNQRYLAGIKSSLLVLRAEMGDQRFDSMVREIFLDSVKSDDPEEKAKITQTKKDLAELVIAKVNKWATEQKQAANKTREIQERARKKDPKSPLSDPAREEQKTAYLQELASFINGLNPLQQAQAQALRTARDFLQQTQNMNYVADWRGWAVVFGYAGTEPANRAQAIRVVKTYYQQNLLNFTASILQSAIWGAEKFENLAAVLDRSDWFDQKKIPYAFYLAHYPHYKNLLPDIDAGLHLDRPIAPKKVVAKTPKGGRNIPKPEVNSVDPQSERATPAAKKPCRKKPKRNGSDEAREKRRERRSTKSALREALKLETGLDGVPASHQLPALARHAMALTPTNSHSQSAAKPQKPPAVIIPSNPVTPKPAPPAPRPADNRSLAQTQNDLGLHLESTITHLTQILQLAPKPYVARLQVSLIGQVCASERNTTFYAARAVENIADNNPQLTFRAETLTAFFVAAHQVHLDCYRLEDLSEQAGVTKPITDCFNHADYRRDVVGELRAANALLAKQSTRA